MNFSAAIRTSKRVFSCSLYKLSFWIIGLSGLTLLTGCPQHSSPHVQAQDNELHFDKHYLDSLDQKPRSARTQRELAILMQLKRLEMLKPYKNKKGDTLLTSKQLNDSVYERTGDGPLIGFRDEVAQRADVYRKIDSLKTLEHIPLTPH